MRVLLSGGGTAGHVYPALSVAATLAAAHDEVTFVGTPNGLEARLVPEAGVAFIGLPSKGFDRARPFSLVLAAFIAFASWGRAWLLLGRIRPDVVIGFGGYVSLPVGLAAVTRGIPLVLHEQNSVPGLANRVLSRWARAIGVTYEESVPLLKVPERATVTGNPVRAEVRAADRRAGRDALGVAEDGLLLLVFGGSRGARHLNSAMIDVADRLLEIDDLVVEHVAGPSEAASVRREAQHLGVDPERWHIHDYLTGMGNAIAAADVVVCRAGATTIAELTTIGAAAILVPYPYATEDHQSKNATALSRHGAALVVSDDELDTEAFTGALLGLLNDRERRVTMSAASRAFAHADAAERVAELARAAANDPSSRGSRENT